MCLTQINTVVFNIEHYCLRVYYATKHHGPTSLGNIA